MKHSRNRRPKVQSAEIALSIAFASAALYAAYLALPTIVVGALDAGAGVAPF